MRISKRKITLIVSRAKHANLRYKCPLCGEELAFKDFDSHTSKKHPKSKLKTLRLEVLKIIDQDLQRKRTLAKTRDNQITNKSTLHIGNPIANIASGNQQSVKSMARVLGWKSNPEDFFALLKWLGVNLQTQLDVMTDEAKQMLANYYGFDTFKEFYKDRTSNQSDNDLPPITLPTDSEKSPFKNHVTCLSFCA